MSFIGGLGKMLGKGLSIAAPFLGKVPGLGTLAGAAAGGLGGLLQGGGLSGTLGGLASGASGGLTGMLGNIARGGAPIIQMLGGGGGGGAAGAAQQQSGPGGFLSNLGHILGTHPGIAAGGAGLLGALLGKGGGNFFGKTVDIGGAPNDVRGLRGDFANSLGQHVGDITNPGAVSSAGPSLSSPFMQQMMDKYSGLFNQNRAEGLAAAKEASGNLTGSGYANALGSAVNRSLGEQNATLGQIGMQGAGMEQANNQFNAGQTNQINTDNAHNYLSGLLGLGTAGTTGPSVAYQPGMGSSILSLLGSLGSAWMGRPQMPTPPGGAQQAPATSPAATTAAPQLPGVSVAPGNFTPTSINQKGFNGYVPPDGSRRQFPSMFGRMM